MTPRGTPQTCLTERQEIALRTEAWLEEVSVAELRRRALAAFADDLLDNPNIAEITRHVLRYRREHGVGGRPVTVLRSVGDA